MKLKHNNHFVFTFRNRVREHADNSVYCQPLSPPLFTLGRNREKEIGRKRSVALFTDHCSWQWAVSRKCLLENNRILPLQPKQHPSTVHRVRVWSRPISGSTEQMLCVNVEPQNETVTLVMCSILPASAWPSRSVSVHLRQPCQTRAFITSEWKLVLVCMCVFGWRERVKLCIYESVCWDASSCDWSLNPFSSNRFIIFTREIVISLNLPFNKKKKKK